jgi:hypothetical protein
MARTPFCSEVLFLERRPGLVCAEGRASRMNASNLTPNPFPSGKGNQIIWES